MNQHVGQDFSSSIRLNLLPGIKIPRNSYQMELQFTTDTGGIITMHHQSMHTDGKDLDVIVGRDVRSIDFLIYPLSANAISTIYYRYSLRVDRLILLNLAVKLLA